jgi:hypothetical protein
MNPIVYEALFGPVDPTMYVMFFAVIALCIVVYGVSYTVLTIRDWLRDGINTRRKSRGDQHANEQDT